MVNCGCFDAYSLGTTDIIPRGGTFALKIMCLVP